jgi:hypothetical protein
MRDVVAVDRLDDSLMGDYLVEREHMGINHNGTSSLHRYEIIRAVVGDVVHQETTDLGDAMQFRNDPVVIIAMGTERVGRLREWAARERDEIPFAQRMGIAVPDMTKMLLDYTEEVWAQSHHRSTFGRKSARVRS